MFSTIKILAHQENKVNDEFEGTLMYSLKMCTLLQSRKDSQLNYYSLLFYYYYVLYFMTCSDQFIENEILPCVPYFCSFCSGSIK